MIYIEDDDDQPGWYERPGEYEFPDDYVGE